MRYRDGMFYWLWQAMIAALNMEFVQLARFDHYAAYRAGTATGMMLAYHTLGHSYEPPGETDIYQDCAADLAHWLAKSKLICPAVEQEQGTCVVG